MARRRGALFGWPTKTPGSLMLRLVPHRGNLVQFKAAAVAQGIALQQTNWACVIHTDKELIDMLGPLPTCLL